MVKVNLGSGPEFVSGWLNCDYSIGLMLSKVGVRITKNRWDRRVKLVNLRKPLPWKDGTVDAVYFSHTLEHLYRKEGIQVLREAFRVLRPGGVFRVVVPSVENLLRNYTNGAEAADGLLEKWMVVPQSQNGLIGSVMEAFSSSAHICMWDEKTLLTRLHEIGFEAAPAKPLQSKIQGISEIEKADRVTRNVAIVDAVKPRIH